MRLASSAYVQSFTQVDPVVGLIQCSEHRASTLSSPVWVLCVLGLVLRDHLNRETPVGFLLAWFCANARRFARRVFVLRLKPHKLPVHVPPLAALSMHVVTVLGRTRPCVLDSSRVFGLGRSNSGSFDPLREHGLAGKYAIPSARVSCSNRATIFKPCSPLFNQEVI